MLCFTDIPQRPFTTAISTPTFHSIEADTFADYALPFIHGAVFGNSFALYLCI
jgi:hypothetical protein